MTNKAVYRAVCEAVYVAVDDAVNMTAHTVVYVDVYTTVDLVTYQSTDRAVGLAVRYGLLWDTHNDIPPHWNGWGEA